MKDWDSNAWHELPIEELIAMAALEGLARRTLCHDRKCRVFMTYKQTWRGVRFTLRHYGLHEVSPRDDDKLELSKDDLYRSEPMILDWLAGHHRSVDESAERYLTLGELIR